MVSLDLFASSSVVSRLDGTREISSRMAAISIAFTSLVALGSEEASAILTISNHLADSPMIRGLLTAGLPHRKFLASDGRDAQHFPSCSGHCTNASDGCFCPWAAY